MPREPKTVFEAFIRHVGLSGSMGRVGACWDNPATESFFVLRQTNGLNNCRSLSARNNA
jgi:transposase InsO family protein